MIYLLQDCYKDNEGEYHDILKIGYSKDNFSKNRQGQYNTHNFGYKFLGEREGSCELENYLHKLLKEYNLDREWFRYSDEIIDKFWKVSEEDISDFSSQDELNKYIRSYILKHLIPSVDKLKGLYLNQILSEIKEKDNEYENNKDIYKRNIIEIFEFVSSKQYNYFSNLDFNSLENIKILEKYNLVFPQNKNNPFKNNITLYYRVLSGSNVLTKEDFDLTENQKRDATQKLLDLFKKATPGEQKEYVQKLKRDSELYYHDFVSISSKTNMPVYNKFIELADRRAWKISQVDYQDSINVTKALSELDYDLSDGVSGDYEIALQNFIHEFEGTNRFSEKLRIYCEYLDYYKDIMIVFDNIRLFVKEPEYQKYYDFYGTPGCKSKKFRKKDLEKGFVDNIRDDFDIIVAEFNVGASYTKKDIKQKLKDIYFTLGITKTPKASDLEKYFEINEVKITNLVTGKRENGFKIISKKI